MRPCFSSNRATTSSQCSCRTGTTPTPPSTATANGKKTASLRRWWPERSAYLSISSTSPKNTGSGLSTTCSMNIQKAGPRTRTSSATAKSNSTPSWKQPKNSEPTWWPPDTTAERSRFWTVKESRSSSTVSHNGGFWKGWIPTRTRATSSASSDRASSRKPCSRSEA